MISISQQTQATTRISSALFPNECPTDGLIKDFQTIIDRYPPVGDRSYTIQANKLKKVGQTVARSTAFDLKPNAGYRKGNPATERPGLNDKKGEYWVTLENVSLVAINELISSGYVTRTYIKLNGNDKKHFVGTDFIWLDFDTEGQTIQESVSNEFLHPFIVYKTPGYDEGLKAGIEKHRILSILSEPVKNYIELEAIIAFFHRLFENADHACIDAGRFMYGSLYPSVHFDPNAQTINVEEIKTNQIYIAEFERISEEYGLKSSGDFKVSLKKTTEAKKKTKELPVHKKIVDKLLNEFEGDLNAFLKTLLPDEEFTFRRRNPDDSSITHKWEGSNPFSASNASKTSLVASIKDDRLMFYSRSRQDDPDDDNVPHGTLLWEFITCVKEKRPTLKVVNTYDEYKQIAKNVCDTLDIPFGDAIDLDSLDLATILDQFIHPELAGKVYRCANIDAALIKDKDVYMVYNEVGRWFLSGSNGVIKLLSNTYQKMFGLPMVNDKYLKLKNGNYEQFPLTAQKETIEHENLDYFYFSNGMYDYKEKVLKPYNPEVVNYFQCDYPYNPNHKGKESLKLLLRTLKKSGVTPKDRKLVIYSFVLTVYQSYFKAMKVLYFYGLKGSGKSTMARFFSWVYPDSVFVAANKVKEAEKNFTKYIGRVSVWDEVISLAGIIPHVMEMIRSVDAHGMSYFYEDKYVPSYKKTLPTTMIFTGEALSIGTTRNVEGYVDRIVAIDFKNTSLGQDGEQWRIFYDDQENGKTIFADLISFIVELNVDVSKLVKYINESQLTSGEQKERLDELLLTADPFYEFVAAFEIDSNFNCDDDRLNPEIKFLTQHELKNLYMTITGDNSVKQNSAMWNAIAQKLSRKFKLINPIAVKKEKKGYGKVWYGIKVNEQIQEQIDSEAWKN